MNVLTAQANIRLQNVLLVCACVCVRACVRQVSLGESLIALSAGMWSVNPFQPSNAMRHHTFNSVLHILQFFGMERVNSFHSKNATIFGAGKG
jgi:hypothetical protein